MELSNQISRFVFDDTNGNLTQIEDLVNGRTFLNDSYGNQLFRILIPSETWYSRHVDSCRTLHPPKMELSENMLIIRFDSLVAFNSTWSKGETVDIIARVYVKLPENSPEAIFTLEIENKSDLPIHEIWFPWVGGISRIDGSGKDKLVLKGEFVDIHTMFKDPKDVSFTLCRNGWHINTMVPLYQPFPWIDVSGENSGLSYIRYMKEPRVLGIVFENLRFYKPELCLAFSWVNYPFIKPGETWKSQPTGIAPHGWDWHATADRYREWCQTWCKPSSAPRSLKTSIGMQVIETRSWDGFRTHSFSELPSMAKKCAEYGINHWSIWDVVGQKYSRPEDNEIFDDNPESSHKELKLALAEMKKIGCKINPLINHRLIKQSSKYWEQYGREMAVQRFDGSFPSESWTSSNYHFEIKLGLFYEGQSMLCQRTEKYKKFALQIVDKVLSLGFTSYFVDQAFEYALCFNKEHRHSSPDNIEGTYEYLKSVSEKIRNHDPEAYVLGEEIHAHAIPYIDLWWVWAHNNRSFTRYVWPEALQLWITSHDDRCQMNYAFAMGMYIGFVTDGNTKTIADYPESTEHVKKLADLRKRCAQWTVDARFLDTVGLWTEGCIAYLYKTINGFSVILAETRGCPSKVKIRIDSERHKEISADMSPVLYRLDGRSERIGELTEEGMMLETELCPYEIGVWVLEKTR